MKINRPGGLLGESQSGFSISLERLVTWLLILTILNCPLAQYLDCVFSKDKNHLFLIRLWICKTKQDKTNTPSPKLDQKRYWAKDIKILHMSHTWDNHSQSLCKVFLFPVYKRDLEKACTLFACFFLVHSNFSCILLHLTL